MNETTRKWIVRANGIWLAPAAIGGLSADLCGAFLGKGPQAELLRRAPEAAIGFVEAHGLALIVGVLLLCKRPERPLHLLGAAIGALLGGSNLLFWQVFVRGDMLAVGYVTTAFHALFLGLGLWAFTKSKAEPEARAPKPELVA